MVDFKIPHIISWSHLQSYDPELLEIHPFPTHSRGNSPSDTHVYSPLLLRIFWDPCKCQGKGYPPLT